jgi:hypothetical protein
MDTVQRTLRINTFLVLFGLSPTLPVWLATRVVWMKWSTCLEVAQKKTGWVPGTVEELKKQLKEAAKAPLGFPEEYRSWSNSRRVWGAGRCHG